MIITINVPIIAYTTVAFEIDVPDDLTSNAQGKLVSQSNPSFSIHEAFINLTDRSLEKVHDETPNWEVDENAIYSTDPNENLSNFIEW